MLKVGLTGAIGSGKSTVGKMFAALGARVIEADVIARELMQPGQSVYEEVVRAFGRDILNPDGTIDRGKVADRAFGSPRHPGSRVAELNRIVHPAVGRAQEQWMAEVGRGDADAVIVVEAALIFEAGLQGQFDRIVVVTCPAETRVQRWMARNHVEETVARRELERRMAAQWPEEKKIASADFVIDNSESLLKSERQVQDVFEALRRTV